MNENKAADDRDLEWRRQLYRRLMLFVLMLAVLAVGIFLYRWIARDLTKGPIGSFYQKTIDADAPRK